MAECQQEVWKDIPGYEGWYQVSTLGRVKRLQKVHWNHGIKNIVKREYILTPTMDRKGYLCVGITDGFKKITRKVHRLVGITFIPNPLNKPQIDHIDRNRQNNRVENLRWVTEHENSINTCTNHNLEYNGMIKTIREWQDITGINQHTILARINRGWSVEDALTKESEGKYYYGRFKKRNRNC